MFTINDMTKGATEAWGKLGSNAVARWRDLNEQYFDGELQPIPLVITNTQPFGKRLAFCSLGKTSDLTWRTITLNVPKTGDVLLADNGVLLHEMVHQRLFERGELPDHASEPWRNEIMRLHLAITGKHIWAGRSKTVRRRIAGRSRVMRGNEANKETGEASISNAAIVRWPYACGICLGKLGGNLKLRVTSAPDAPVSISNR